MPELLETLPPSCLASPVERELDVELLAEAVPMVVVPMRLLISSAVS